MLADLLIKEKRTDFDLVNLINRKLESIREVPLATPDRIYRVSEMPRLCPREEVLRVKLNRPKSAQIDARLQRVFDIGTAVHSLVQEEWFAKWGMLWGAWGCQCGFHTDRSVAAPKPETCQCGNPRFRYIEMELRAPGIRLGGHPDGVLVHEGRKYVLELKSCNSKQFDLLTRIKNKPLASHVDQIQLYMCLLGIEDGIILYFEKDESQLHQFSVRYSEEHAFGLLGRLIDIREYHESGKVPGREMCENIGCARAKSCVVPKECFRG